MKSKHVYVTLIDLPETLPFETSQEKSKPEKIAKEFEDSKKSETELFNFVNRLEKNFKEEFSFIGDDLIGEKFYKRFLFQKDGFLEIMYQRPAAIIAHFIDEKRATLFSQALKKTLEETVKDKKLLMILQNLVEVNKEKEDLLTYDKWTKLTKIRRMT